MDIIYRNCIQCEPNINRSTIGTQWPQQFKRLFKSTPLDIALLFSFINRRKEWGLEYTIPIHIVYRLIDFAFILSVLMAVLEFDSDEAVDIYIIILSIGR